MVDWKRRSWFIIQDNLNDVADTGESYILSYGTTRILPEAQDAKPAHPKSLTLLGLLKAAAHKRSDGAVIVFPREADSKSQPFGACARCVSNAQDACKPSQRRLCRPTSDDRPLSSSGLRDINPDLAHMPAAKLLPLGPKQQYSASI